MLLKPDKKWNTTNMTIALHIAVSVYYILQINYYTTNTSKTALIHHKTRQIAIALHTALSHVVYYAIKQLNTALLNKTSHCTLKF